MFIPKYEKKTDVHFSFGERVNAAAHESLNNEAIKSFWNGFCCQIGELLITPTDEFAFCVGTAQKPELSDAQYAVNVEQTGLYIVGRDKKGLINGFMTLLHQIKVRKAVDGELKFEIACGSFREKPRFEKQMVHFCIFPETKLWELERFIRLSAVLKYSHIVLEFWGMLQYDCLKELAWSFAYSKEQIRPLIRMANDLGVEIIPMFNHWGHASASRMQYGKHVVLDQNPRLQPLFSDDGWTWNIQSPDTLKLLQGVRNELIDLCGEGEFFHLGCDEAYNFEITVENHTVLTDYLNGIAGELALVGRRPIVWGDMLITRRESFHKNNRYTASCSDLETERSIFADLSREVIIADWQYCVREAPVETALIFKEAGFDTLLCPWDFTCGNSVSPCVTTAVEYDLFGVLHTTWDTISKGMCDVARVAYLVWSDTGEGNTLPRSFFAVNTAKVLRKVFPVNGDYEKAGWCKEQIVTLM